MGLLERIASARVERRSSIDMWLGDYLIPSMNQWGYQAGYNGITTTWVNGKVQEYSATLPGHSAAVRACPPAFAAQMVRALVISQARFTFRNLPSSNSPRRTFGTTALEPLERPWRNATTGELLSRMEWHAGLAGNAFVTNYWPGRLRVLRPDWVAIIYGSKLEPDDAAFALDGEVIGYAYCNGGLGGAGRNDVRILLPDEVAHWSPLPDPEGAGIGMSWISAAMRDILGDRAATEHKLNFFANSATPQMVVKGIPAADREKFDMFVDMLEARHAGVGNAYRTLYLAAGADATVVGANLAQMDFKATQGAGEALALDTPLPTPTGWTTMGEVQAGDQLLGSDGKPCTVLDTSPVHTGRPCYRVTFDDGASIVADARHLWQVKYCRTRVGVFATEQLLDTTYTQANGWKAYKHHVPMASPLDLPVADLPVDPYVLGVWLGDGTSKDATVASGVEDAQEMHQLLERSGYKISRYDRRTCVMFTVHGLAARLRGIGVLDNKHIPEMYLRASLPDRLALLQGLMDSDGTVERSGSAVFYNTNQRLAEQCAELARTLGYAPKVVVKADDREVRYLDLWKVGFTPQPATPVFQLKRKLARCKTKSLRKHDWRAIVSIEPVESVPVRCVMVDSLDSLYMAGEGMVLTHNTRVAMLGRVPAPLLGISEGLAGSSLNAGNFGMARRIFADSWIFPTLQDLCAALAPLVKVPPGAELWFDTADMPILREDAKDAAEIEQIKATTINSLITAGFTPESAVIAVRGQDITLLKHSGLVSVQLQPPGAQVQPAQAGGAGPKVPAVARAVRHRAIDQRKFNPDQPRDPHSGEWIDGVPGSVIKSAVKDALKLAGKIDLGKDEHLLGSGKFDGDSGARWAMTELHGQPRLRLGLGGEGFGQRDYDEGLPAWNGNNDMDQLNAERAALRDERDRLEAEWDGASPQRRKQIDARIEQIEKMDLNEIYSNGATAILDSSGMDRLRQIDTAAEAADRVAKAEDKFWAEVGPEIEAEATRLEAERNRLIADLDAMNANIPSPWTDEQKAEYQRKLKRVKELHGARDRIYTEVGKRAPVQDYMVFGEGVIPGTDWGDVHYLVYIDDPTQGARVNVGVKPRGADADWELDSENSGTYDYDEWLKIFRQIQAAREAFRQS